MDISLVQDDSAVTNIACSHTMPCVVLGTARVPVLNDQGQQFITRALLDSGSSGSFVSTSAAARMHLRQRSCNVSVSTVGSEQLQRVSKCVTIYLASDKSCSEFALPVECMVFDRVVGLLPHGEIPIPDCLRDILLGEFADPEWNVPGAVDLLLGADIYHSVVISAPCQRESITLIGSIYGYVVSGPVPSQHVSDVACFGTSLTDLAIDMQAFWNVEEVPSVTEKLEELDSLHEVICKSDEEKFAEDSFLNHCVRDSEGRWCTTHPIFRDISLLGNSSRMAMIRFLNLEKMLLRMPNTYQDYRLFIQELVDTGHMELVPDSEKTSSKVYYIPHHCVRKEDSTTTKLRVVFDASAKSSTGVSLNDVLAAGPKLQDDLFHILIRFRFHNVAIIGDIAKMYRQVKLDKSSADLQRLFWRDTVDEEVRVYRITRVMYGVKSAGHSAVKALVLTVQRYAQKCDLFTQRLLLAALRNFYVDDWLSGASSVAEAGQLLRLVCECLSSGGWDLRKIASSEPALVNMLPEEKRENVDAFEFCDDEHLIKTLGVAWLPLVDAFTFKVKHLDAQPISAKDEKRASKAFHQRSSQVNLTDDSQTGNVGDMDNIFTRRQILSDLAKIFDPLGLLSPAVIRLKICMQDIWRTQLGWDDPLPSDITKPYLEWRASLVLLRDLKIPRRVLSFFDGTRIELHVFCDASTKAYGAAVYVRQSRDGEIICNLLASKGKVAPLKQLTVPKLELCAALSGAKLVSAVLHALRHTELQIEIFAWTDSTTVWHWLRSFPGRWQTFVANRVAQIQELVSASNWYHVPTNDNPADVASRGVAVSELLSFDLWWYGPTFLRDPVLCFPPQPDELAVGETLPEEKVVCATSTCTSQDAKTSLWNVISLENFSSVDKLINVVAFVFRFLSHCKKRPAPGESWAYPTSVERRLALRRVVVAEQDRYYEAQKAKLSKNEQLPKSESLTKLYPFIDSDDGVLKVGGRLQALKDSWSDESLYPAILPKNSHLSLLLARRTHGNSLHGGLLLCMSQLRRSFWIVSSRQLFREVIRDCVKCHRFNSRPQHALMGDLPKERVTASPPFSFAGLDFAGPLTAKIQTRAEKVYLAVFVCFSTKAVHIELVTGLTAQGCIGALHRFVARRGVPTRLHSDNATNFTGARLELARLRSVLDATRGSLPKEAARLGMEWVFIPPGSPNFGGLWEAAVKSAKTHVKKVIGKSVLNYEELHTLLCNVESVMNSRPLTALSDDPKDFTALTPFMLLAGRGAGALPMLKVTTPVVTDLTRMQPGKRWQYVQGMSAEFWRRWKKEYVTSLQQRTKHQHETPNLCDGDLVLLTDENSPPLEWPLGRIVKAIAGNDGQVRTVLVRTATGEYKRPAYKARKLPGQDVSVSV